MGIIVLIAIVFILWKWRGLRAYLACSFFLIGVGGAIAGCIMEDHFFVLPGIVMTLIGLLISFLSVMRNERSQWISGMIHFLIYGFMLFLRIVAVCLLIGIPLMSLFNAMCDDWQEVVIVDAAGRDTGRRVTVNSHGKDPYGNKYQKY